MSSNIRADKKMRVVGMYRLLDSLLESMDNAQRAKKVLSRIQTVKEKDKVSDAGLAEEFIIKHSPIINDVSLAENIKDENLGTFKTALSEVRDTIGEDLARELLAEVYTQDEHGISKVSDVVKKIEANTGIKHEPDNKDEKVFTIDDYFLNMANTYSKIAKGLSQTISQLDEMIDMLENQISNDLGSTTLTEENKEAMVVEESEGKREVETAAEKEEREPDIKKTKPSKAKSVEEIELGMSFDDMPSEQEFAYGDDNVEEMAPKEDDNDISAGLALFSGAVPKKEEEEPEEAARMTP